MKNYINTHITSHKIKLVMDSHKTLAVVPAIPNLTSLSKNSNRAE